MPFKAALQNAVAELLNVVPSGASVDIRTETDKEGVQVVLIAKHLGASSLDRWSGAFAPCQAFVQGFGNWGYLRGQTRSFWRAVRPYFTGLSRSRFIMAERESAQK
jgi:hypothetical protein